MKVFLSVLFAFKSFSCTVTGAETVFTYANKTPFSLESCASEEIEKFNDVVMNSSGVLKQEIVNSLTDMSFSLVPSTIRIRSLEQLIISRLNLDESYKAEILEQNINPELLTLSTNDFLNISCNSCNNTGVKNIILTKTQNGRNANQWIKIKLLKTMPVLTSKYGQNVNFHGIDKNTIQLENIAVDTNDDYFTDIQNINFYRFNKNISANTPIKKSDLTAMQVIKPGQRVKVIMNNSNINLSTLATSLQGGFMGDEIRLKNEKTNKTFSARVIGVGEASLDL